MRKLKAAGWDGATVIHQRLSECITIPPPNQAYITYYTALYHLIQIKLYCIHRLQIKLYCIISPDPDQAILHYIAFRSSYTALYHLIQIKLYCITSPSDQAIHHPQIKLYCITSPPDQAILHYITPRLSYTALHHPRLCITSPPD